jgi:hypothetical protein
MSAPVRRLAGGSPDRRTVGVMTRDGGVGLGVFRGTREEVGSQKDGEAICTKDNGLIAGNKDWLTNHSMGLSHPRALCTGSVGTPFSPKQGKV